MNRHGEPLNSVISVISVVKKPTTEITEDTETQRVTGS
jgi:hypothetical protein